MPDRIMAAQTFELRAGRFWMRRFDRVDDFSMTVAACLLGNLAAVRLDLNVVFVAAGGEKK